jgi:nitrite reductase (NADH) small subunit
MTWTAICEYPRLLPERGVAALVADTQVAVFRTHDGSVYAINNLDPVSGAAVLSRGIVGNRGDVPTVASPIYKEVYDLRTGECLDRADLRVPVYPVRVRDGVVEVGLTTVEPAGVGTASSDTADLVGGLDG